MISTNLSNMTNVRQNTVAWSDLNLKYRTDRYHGPTETGKTGKPGKMRRHFPVREKSGNFTQNAGKSEKNILKKSGKFVSQ